MTRHTAEALLERARAAETPVLRAKYATTGLRQPHLESDTQTLLLRQLYLAYLEREHYEDARSIAEQMVELGSLGDVALHDVARACLCLGDVRGAAAHLRTASRSGPPSRRAFHLSCLGSLHLYEGRIGSAIVALRRAVRWAAEDRTLYRAQLAVALARNGDRSELAAAFAALTAAKPKAGYADFVLGEMALQLGKRKLAERKLRSFEAQVATSSISVRAGLRCETERAKDLLLELSHVTP
jgi:tetratricopeptide (TPR) repeat protein